MEKGTISAFPFHYSRAAWLRRGYCMVCIILKPKLNYVFKLLDLRQKTFWKGFEISLTSGWTWQNNHLKFFTQPFQSMEWKVFGLQNLCQQKPRKLTVPNGPNCYLLSKWCSYPPNLAEFLAWGFTRTWSTWICFLIVPHPQAFWTSNFLKCPNRFCSSRPKPKAAVLLHAV